MKVVVLIALIFWFVFTLILTCSIIGMLLFLPTTYIRGANDPSTWMLIGRKLTDKLLKD